MSQPAQAQKSDAILLVSDAVTKAADDRTIPLLVADHRKQTGLSVRVKSSFGGSGSRLGEQGSGERVGDDRCCDA